MVYTKFNRPKTKPTCAGKRYLNVYEETTDEKGRLCLEKVGERNVYDEIQADADSADIKKILQAVARGDLSALQQREAVYADSTTLPKTMMELQNFIIKTKNEFYDMPLEVRKLFDNSPEEFVAQMGTPEYLEKMKGYNEQLAKISEEKSHKEYLKKVKEGAQLNYDIKRAEEALAGGVSNE